MARQQRTEPAPRDPAKLAADRERIVAETDAGVAAYGEAVAHQLSPLPDAQPSVQQDEHRGLAGRILELRNTIEEQRLAAVQERAQIGQRMAQLEQLVSAMATRIDREVEAIGKQQRDLGNSLREAGEQVRVAGELARKMRDQVKVLEELREMASDPHEVVKPLQRGLALLRRDLEALAGTIDVRFEQMPKNRSQPLESRGEDEQPLVKMGAEIRKLKERVTDLETS